MNPRGALLQAWVIDTPLLAPPSPAAGPRVTVAAGDGTTGGGTGDSTGGGGGLPLMQLGHKRVRPCTTSSDWPARTDVWCWYCCHPFTGPPLPMPIKYDDRRDVFHVTGTFCSWACMKAHNSESSGYLKNVNAMHIALFHRRCTGKVGRIPPAPPRIALRVFGGSLGIDEFRAASEQGRTFNVLPPKMIVHHAALEETSVKARPKPCNLAETVSFKDASAKNETLRLKRPKPLQHNRNTLERAMGINALMGV